MIRFYKRNRIISFLGIVALAVVISYAATYNIPNFHGTDGWYALFNNISISYIAALIFYVLQVYKPECENSKKSQKILSPLFADLVKYMEVIIACIQNYFTIKEDGKLEINWSNKEKKIIYCVAEVEKSEGKPQCAMRLTKEKLQNSGAEFKKKICEIKESIAFKSCDPEILDVISKMERTDFFEHTLLTAVCQEKTFIEFQNFQKAVNEFEQEKEELKQVCGIKRKYKIRDAEAMEIAVSEVILNQKALSAKTVEQFNEIACREYLNQQLCSVIQDETERKSFVNDFLPEYMSLAKGETRKKEIVL